MGAVVNMATVLGVRRLYALCHVQPERSVRVRERCGLVREGTLRKKHGVF
jgi:RimJ/RimL family protein N-acetyltransferase